MTGSDVDSNNFGRQIILPETQIGSPRGLHAIFQDGMATERKYGKPHLFITMTCSPTWKEIQSELLLGQDAEDRPDLVSRVLQMKPQSLEEEILKDGIFGAKTANMRVIEFKKCGLPHAQMLIILQRRHAIAGAQQVHQIVSAEFPPHPGSVQDEGSNVQIHKTE